MEAITCKVVDKNGKEQNALTLDPEVFGVEPHEAMVHEVVRWQLAKRRAGTHATLTRSNMKATGKKPFKQKGTGQARAGSSVSPLWVGGAVVFGPQPRDYEFRISRRTKKAALASVLSEKTAAGKLIVMNEIEVEGGKTKNMVALLEKLGLTGSRVLLVLADGSQKAEQSPAWRSARNISKVKPLAVQGVNVYDILRSDVVVTTSSAIEKIVEGIKGNK